jgi:Zn-dependent metalloprotease
MIRCIIPPHMFESIAENGSPLQQQSAQSNLVMSAQLREERHEAPGAPRPPGAAPEGKQRTVYTAGNGTNLPGTRVRGEGEGASGDAAVDEAYDGSGDTYDLYDQAYGRASIDGSNGALISTVHYQVGYDNAFWNGTQMVYGDGDENLPEAERLFNRFTKSLDVIGHELTHGVTQHTADLVYLGQPGALNESFSDVFGVLVVQRKLNQAATAADWLVGSELFTENVAGSGIRSMKAPGTAYDDPVLGKDPQPAHMDDYVNTSSDNGGVHINSGIPNHAFYRAATELGGFAWEQAGTIWYRTLTDARLTSQASFQQAASLTFTVAGELFGAGSAQQTAVVNGWNAVGIDPVGGDDGGPQPSGCLPFARVIGGLVARG